MWLRPWDDTPTPLQMALARGHRWLALLETGVSPRQQVALHDYLKRVRDKYEQVLRAHESSERDRSAITDP